MIAAEMRLSLVFATPQFSTLMSLVALGMLGLLNPSTYIWGLNSACLANKAYPTCCIRFNQYSLFLIMEIVIGM